jgi:hypothetical protein
MVRIHVEDALQFPEAFETILLPLTMVALNNRVDNKMHVVALSKQRRDLMAVAFGGKAVVF